MAGSRPDRGILEQGNAAMELELPSSRIIGTGEMADLVRGYDWNSTTLGPIEAWSKELVTIVNLTLASSSPVDEQLATGYWECENGHEMAKQPPNQLRPESEKVDGVDVSAPTCDCGGLAKFVSPPISKNYEMLLSMHISNLMTGTRIIPMHCGSIPTEAAFSKLALSDSR